MSSTAVFVGAVVRHGERILLVRQSPGHALEGQWTIPWGRVEDGESPVAAAARETLEEGGIVAEVEGMLGMQELPAPREGCFALVFLCAHAGGTPQPQDRETDAARYFGRAELDVLGEPVEPWSEWLVRRVLAGDFRLTCANPSSPLRPRGAFL